jgi:hypothetical protein
MKSQGLAPRSCRTHRYRQILFTVSWTTMYVLCFALADVTHKKLQRCRRFLSSSIRMDCGLQSGPQASEVLLSLIAEKEQSCPYHSATIVTRGREPPQFRGWQNIHHHRPTAAKFAAAGRWWCIRSRPLQVDERMQPSYCNCLDIVLTDAEVENWLHALSQRHAMLAGV